MFAEDPEEMEVLASKRDRFIPCYTSISKTGWLRPRYFSGLTGETLPSLPACTHPVKLKHSPQNVLQAKKKPLCAAFSVTGWECSYFAPEELICRTVAERPPAQGDGVVITKPWLTFAQVFSTCLL